MIIDNKSKTLQWPLMRLICTKLHTLINISKPKHGRQDP